MVSFFWCHEQVIRKNIWWSRTKFGRRQSLFNCSQYVFIHSQHKIHHNFIIQHCFTIVITQKILVGNTTIVEIPYCFSCSLSQISFHIKLNPNAQLTFEAFKQLQFEVRPNHIRKKILFDKTICSPFQMTNGKIPFLFFAPICSSFV